MFDSLTSLTAGNTVILFVLLIAFNLWLFRRNQRQLQRRKRKEP